MISLNLNGKSSPGNVGPTLLRGTLGTFGPFADSALRAHDNIALIATADITTVVLLDVLAVASSA